MKWDITELDRRCSENTFFKSKDCNNAKALLATITKVDLTQVEIGSPESIETEEQLKFVKLVHQRVLTRKKQKKPGSRSLLQLPAPVKAVFINDFRKSLVFFFLAQ